MMRSKRWIMTVKIISVEEVEFADNVDINEAIERFREDDIVDILDANIELIDVIDCKLKKVK